jgi:O-methyltransferase
MNLPVFQILNYSLIIIVLVIFIRYMWDVFFDRNYQPAGWQHAVKEGRISKKLKQLERSYPDKVRFFNWWFQVKRLNEANVPGDFAELGVYKGESVRILLHMDPARKFHLFDTFQGFSASDLAEEQGEAATYTPDNFADTSAEGVVRFLNAGDRIILHKGHFPETTKGFTNERFALVNIDADLYNPTRAGLEFFYPRLSPGGVLLVHDYNPKWEGVMKAVDDFIATIPENPDILPDMEGTIMIIRNK